MYTNTTTNKRKVGRPTKYSEALAIEICTAIATEKVGLDRIIDSHPNFPDDSQIFRWILTKPKFREMYELARTNQKFKLAEEILNVSYCPEFMEDIVTEPDMSGNLLKKTKVFDNVQRSKLKVDALKWTLARLDPQKYGDSTKITGDSNDPLQVIVKHIGQSNQSNQSSQPQNKK